MKNAEKTWTEWTDQLEMEHGLDIFGELVQTVKKCGTYETVRFKDSTKNSSETLYYNRGKKPILKSNNTAETNYEHLHPLNAYILHHHLCYKDALADLVLRYYGEDLRKSTQKKQEIQTKAENKFPYIPEHFLEKSFGRNKKSNLFKFCADKFGTETTQYVFDKYMVGTDKELNTIFWFHDGQGFRAGKYICYQENGKRNQKIFPQHYKESVFGLNKELKACLFGEHLLNPKTEHIFLVESEKTAMFCLAACVNGLILNELESDSFVFLATGGANGLSEEKAKVLKDKTIFLVNDCDQAGRIGFGVLPIIEFQGLDIDKTKLNKYIHESYLKNNFGDTFFSREQIEEVHAEILEYASTDFSDKEGTLNLKIKSCTLINHLKKLNCSIFHWDINPAKNDKYDMGDYVVDRFLEEQTNLYKTPSFIKVEKECEDFERLRKAYDYALFIFAGESMLLFWEFEERIKDYKAEKDYKPEKVLQTLLDWGVIWKRENAYFGDIFAMANLIE